MTEQLIHDFTCLILKCPDCKQGKHDNCTGSWCVTHDSAAPCSCTHPRPLIGVVLPPAAEVAVGEYGKAIKTSEPEPYTGDPYDERDSLREPKTETRVEFTSAPGARINPAGRTAYELLRGMTYAAFGQTPPPVDERHQALRVLLMAIGAAYGEEVGDRLTQRAVGALHALGVSQDELAAALRDIA